MACVIVSHETYTDAETAATGIREHIKARPAAAVFVIIGTLR